MNRGHPASNLLDIFPGSLADNTGRRVDLSEERARGPTPMALLAIRLAIKPRIGGGDGPIRICASHCRNRPLQMSGPLNSELRQIVPKPLAQKRKQLHYG